MDKKISTLYIEEIGRFHSVKLLSSDLMCDLVFGFLSGTNLSLTVNNDAIIKNADNW